MGYAIELLLGKVGGDYLKNITIDMAATAAIIASTKSKTKNWSFAFLLSFYSVTNKGGIKNPMAVPIILTTVRTAMARDLLLYKKIIYIFR
jgi:hypothetical protein